VVQREDQAEQGGEDDEPEADGDDVHDEDRGPAAVNAAYRNPSRASRLREDHLIGALSAGLSYEQMPQQRQFRNASTRVMSVVMIVIGLVLLVRTVIAGGGALATGILLGVLFVAAGSARLYLQFRG
jgi:hypothetical protein